MSPPTDTDVRASAPAPTPASAPARRSHPLRTQLTKGAGPTAALLIAVLVPLLLNNNPGPWQDSWAETAEELRMDGTVLTAPLALALGCWLGGRERRRGTGELLLSMPRPPMARALAAAAPAAVWPMAGFALGAGICSGQTLQYASPVEPRLVPLLAANTVFFGAAGLFGFAVGRLVRWRITAPVLAMLGLVGMALTGSEWAGTPATWLHPSFEHRYQWDSPVWWLPLALVVWYGGVGIAALTAAAARRRPFALAPLAAALAAAALLVSTGDGLWQPDVRAAGHVCTHESDHGQARVCLTRLHSRLLPDTSRLLAPISAKLAPVAHAPHRFVETTPHTRADEVRLPELRPQRDDPYAEHGTLHHREEYGALAAQAAALPECPRLSGSRKLNDVTIGVVQWLFPHHGWDTGGQNAASKHVTKRLRTMPSAQRTAWLDHYFTAARACRPEKVKAP